ncbi:MAG TPA: hypothetical protein VMV69_29690 [Pirellulales bacterium]|nr:hypothetical protein [Pirellulales bacterium]
MHFHFRALFRLRNVPVLLAVGAIIALGAWLAPRRIEGLALIDGSHRWLAEGAPARRQIVWQPADELTDLVPPRDPPDSLSHPHWADGGTMLYFTLRRARGDADLYRARWLDGRWEEAVPLVELNTPSDEVGVSVASDGKELYLASDRPGGEGGFDLYVSRRTQSGWGLPRNLGKAVNTAADERDVTPAPDGLRLFFASDRATSPTKSDLYVLRRPPAGGPWSAAVALPGVNLAGSNERGPLVSPDGAFLYFSSDRPARPREPVNFDLYRARLTEGGQVGKPENLGLGVNTSADEAGLALSADGFALALTSNRASQGDSRRWAIYRSTAAEVERVTAWDTSHWQAFTVVWWKALSVTLLLAGLAAVVRYSRGWLFGAASMARFLFASLLSHALIVGLLLLVPLSQEIAQRVHEIRESQAAADVFEDVLHPSREAYQRVADLRSVDAVAVAVADLPRQSIQPPRGPLPNDNMPAPALPADLAARLPPNRVIFVPPRRAAPAEELLEIERREMAAAPRAAEIEALAVELSAAEAMPVEAPLNRKVELANTATDAIPARTAPLVPRAPLELTVEPAEFKPDMDQAAPLADAPLDVREARRAPVPRSAEPMVPEAEIPKLVLATPAPGLDSLPADADKATLERRDAPPPTPRETAAVAEFARIRVMVDDTYDAAKLRPEASPAAAIEGPPLPWRERSLPQRAVGPPADDAPAPAAVEKPVAAALAGAVELRLPDAMPIELAIETPDKLAGPDNPLRREFIAGALANKAMEAPPSISPLAVPPRRPPAGAAPVAYAEDNIGMQAMFALRQGATRREFIELVGGTDQSETAVKRGLDWLAQHQHADGRWSLHQLDPPEKKLPATAGAGGTQSDTAATGFGLLPFLASGHTHQAGDYQTVVGQAIRWLTEHQKPSGDLFTGPASSAHMYSHGIAAIALCEAYGLSQDAALREPAQRALSFIVASQNPSTGGWRYLPGEPGDTSVVGWQVMALKSGEMAGLAVPLAALELANKWLASAAGTGGSLGTFGYQGSGGGPAMSAEGLLCRQFLGARRGEPQMRAGATYLLQNLPQPGRETSYYWYYATQVMYHMQGDYWTRWNEHLRDMLVGSQVKDGHQAGTWNPQDQWEQSGGRLFATSLRLLMLEVYYRHLPLYQQLED